MQNNPLKNTTYPKLLDNLFQITRQPTINYQTAHSKLLDNLSQVTRKLTPITRNPIPNY